MMSDAPLPDPPEVRSLDPQLMTASELQVGLELLFGWLQQVEAQPEAVLKRHVDEDAVQEIRDAANMLLTERRERHSDEHAPRGG